ncbi:pantoate--beta-alanine ligase [Paenibacillus yanchengensis]|uniref:Pantothenate synthetase n=1 Tax=Paenibacillus yanchengensis TaxID=2035833 RepID=A0ABW4YJM5_9BACL
MITCHTISDLQQQLQDYRSEGKQVGFVPTMGYLHAGHASLLHNARQNNDIVVLSIFVNPLQFGVNEDLDRYPRNMQQDTEVARNSGVDIIFAPTVEEMYPQQPLTKITVAQVTDLLCGATRPGHFDGVGIVVTKLFHIVKPDRAYFGMKDAQQVAVVETIVRDLNMDVEIVRCPIIREPDGLALSSRNVYLSAEQRAQAVIISESLAYAEQLFLAKEMTGEQIVEQVRQKLQSASLARIDYLQLLSYPQLKQIDLHDIPAHLEEQLLLATAVYFGETRLIDNCLWEG